MFPEPTATKTTLSHSDAQISGTGSMDYAGSFRPLGVGYGYKFFSCLTSLVTDALTCAHARVSAATHSRRNMRLRMQRSDHRTSWLAFHVHVPFMLMAETDFVDA
jgi:hypothetical protein